MNILTDILARRQAVTPYVGYNPHNFLELTGAEMVEIWPYAPNPVTHRQDYYYDSASNRLFKRIWMADKPKEGMVAVWKPVSESVSL
jgi:hypothetical protein